MGLTVTGSRLDGVLVSLLATGPCRGDGFLKAINIRSTLSFGWEVKPEVPGLKKLPRVKDARLMMAPCEQKRVW
jgi:hypothetical protein